MRKKWFLLFPQKHFFPSYQTQTKFKIMQNDILNVFACGCHIGSCPRFVICPHLPDLHSPVQMSFMHSPEWFLCLPATLIHSNILQCHSIIIHLNFIHVHSIRWYLIMVCKITYRRPVQNNISKTTLSYMSIPRKICRYGQKQLSK